MDPLKEAIEICESMMVHKDRNGLGRLHILLCIVQERYFVGVEDDDSPHWSRTPRFQQLEESSHGAPPHRRTGNRFCLRS